MDILSTLIQNLTSPAVLFFVLGVSAGLLKSDLDVPESISRYLAIYLMVSIGIKGGAAMAATEHWDIIIISAIAIGVAFSFLQPFLGFALLTRTTRLDRPTAAAVSAHYGSISMVTFVTAAAFLKSQDIHYAGYVVAILALMEAPAILSGLYIAHRAAPETDHHQQEERRLAKEIFANGAILLLLGSFAIGWITGDQAISVLGPFFIEPFQGVLALFLLDMGLLVARQSQHLSKFTWSLTAFAIYMPLIGAALGVTAAWLLGMDVGTGTLFIILVASASYIAVPAAMRLTLPEANAAIYLPMALGITFPFNLALGIPLYHALAKMVLGQP